MAGTSFPLRVPGPHALAQRVALPVRRRGRRAAVNDAAARLARSRQALVEAMAPSSLPREDGEPGGRFGPLRSAAGNWWRDHPVHVGLQLATPLLSTCAGRWPWPFLAVAAATGALIVVARPWRLLLVSGVPLALAKFSRVPGLLLSALGTVGAPRLPDTQARRIAAPPWRNEHAS